MANQQGWGQQTPAIQSLLRGAIGGTRSASPSSRKRKKKAAGAKRAKRSASGSKKPKKSASRGKMKAGSAAAKAWGKKMKALRKKK